MPFTVSHVAAALPFRRAPLPIAGLVIGTMAPDRPYFLPTPTFRGLTHEPLGIVTIDLVIGVLAWVVWRVVRRPVVALSPSWARRRVGEPDPAPWQSGARWWVSAHLLVAALLLGSVTHLILDAPTHPGWLAQHVPFLDATVLGTLVTRWLQEGFSVVLGALLVLWIWRWVRRTEPHDDPVPEGAALRLGLWIAVVVVFALAVVVAWGVQVAGGARLLDPVVTFRVARISIGVALAGSIAACVIMAVRTRRS